MKNEITAKRFIDLLKTYQSAAEREKTLRYFKTPANGEADQFIGVRMGQVFALAKEFITMTPDQIEKLLESKIHEVRAGACSIMDKQARSKKTSPERRKELYDLYLRRHDRINNWDLVDVCSIHVVGGYLFDKPRKILYKLACSKNMWERRTAIVSTAYFIRKDELDDAYKIAEMLLGDKEDLVHKATGWMLRFAGDKDRPRLLEFLDQHAATMPRVALRYAMEHLDKKQRDHYLGLKKRTMTKPVFNLAAILVMLVACAAVSVLAVPQAKVATRKEVKVYFYHDPGEYIDLMPVTRSVNANARTPGYRGATQRTH
jgi:3-methyladenine DNA glycosylase AlkD